jgi:hypothetical protein
MRLPPVFDDKEEAILLSMYEVENGTYDSYTLARKLNTTVEVATPPAGTAFAKTRGATERLISHDLVRGERLSGADGVYFTKLKLTAKGQRAAIQLRRTVEERKKAFEEAAKQASRIVAEMEKFTEEK